MKSFMYFNFKNNYLTIEMIKVKACYDNPFLGLFEFNIMIYTSQNLRNLTLGLSFGVWALGFVFSQSKCYIILLYLINYLNSRNYRCIKKIHFFFILFFGLCFTIICQKDCEFFFLC
jgi:hypothetical protein